MFPIVSKRPLNEAGTVLEYVIKAPLVAKKCLPGQFIVLRLDEHGERVPLTIADYDREAGTVTIMVQPVGQTTRMLELMEPGDCLADFVGPMGKPTQIGGSASSAAASAAPSATPCARASLKPASRSIWSPVSVPRTS